jgi:hypothetical protein
MNVVGFTFIRNAILYDYPVKEAIESILPLCNRLIVAVGNSSDKTLELINSIAPDKITVIETVWDDTLREGGRVLADETNKAYQAIPADADWCFYIQGDEVLHEQYHDTVREAMLKYKDNVKVDGLLFKYKHFYGSYDYVGASPRWYPNEIRVVRRNNQIYSYRDAQGFRKADNQKLRVKPINAFIYHYGWVKDPMAQQRKQETFHKLWHPDQWLEKNVAKAEAFDYSQVDALKRFTGTHPAVMQDRINRLNWTFDHDISINRMNLKNRFKHLVKEYLGVEIGYKNYRRC